MYNQPCLANLSPLALATAYTYVITVYVQCWHKMMYKFLQGKRSDNTLNKHDVVKRQTEQNCHCKDGNPGLRGPPGNKGEIGMKGKQGAKGDTGSSGPRGDTGDRGSQGRIGVQLYITIVM